VDEHDEERAEESREEAGEKSARPDIQAGAMRMSEGDEPETHEHPSYRDAADEEEDS
jgi:hypothetical protein